ncbi:MAG TPA: OmpA family protein [Usitatibacter sp.]|nr:OmpA family protein [Usitatibacter sp.]
MNPLISCAAAAALALASTAVSASHSHDRWHGARYYPRYVPRHYYPYLFPAPLFGYYAPRPIYVPVAPPPPVYVERYRVYEDDYPPPPPPPRAQREQRDRYAQIEPPRQARPATPAAPTPSVPPPRFERYTLSAKELFGFDQATLRMPQPKLDEIARALVDNPGIGQVTITGYTDRLGTEAYNQKLSERRADAVKQYLVGKGVAPNRLQAIGRGEANPVVQCNDADRERLIKCLEPNRRVEVEQITIERAAPAAR